MATSSHPTKDPIEEYAIEIHERRQSVYWLIQALQKMGQDEEEQARIGATRATICMDAAMLLKDIGERNVDVLDIWNAEVY